MSRKSRRNRPETEAAAAPASAAPRASRLGLVAGVVAVLLIVVLAFVALRHDDRSGDDPARQAALASEHSPSIGDAGARVHIVEFLDPACETCAAFYPLGKQLVDQEPGRVRISLRHVAFHEGAEYAVRALEASRAQDRYWQVLERLLATQPQWAPHHTVQPELVMVVLQGLPGLDFERLRADMESAEVSERVARDRADAMTLAVTATPEYFVNGRPLPSFGHEQLLALVREELDRAY